LSILYVRLPARAVASNSTAPVCRFALAPDDGTNLRQGFSTLAELAGLLREAKQVVLLPSASDVTLLRMQTPPLSTSKLKAALPALVEDRLLCDPAECALAAGDERDGWRTIAVADRGWLNLFAETLYRLGARRVSAVPFPLCLPRAPGSVSACAQRSEAGIELAVSAGAQEGAGLLLPPDASPTEVLQTLRVLVPQEPVTLYAETADIGAYLAVADGRITVVEEQWARWVSGGESSINLLTASGIVAGSAMDWKPWRWALALAAAVAAINIAGLQIDWWRLRSEEQDLRAAMLQTFKAAYPQETVIADPLAQMQQKLAAARNRAGLPAHDDFIVLSAALAEAWAGAAQAHQLPPEVPGIASLEYRERSLLVKWKAPSPIAMAELQPALAGRNLALSQTADAWQIRSIK